MNRKSIRTNLAVGTIVLFGLLVAAAVTYSGAQALLGKARAITKLNLPAAHSAMEMEINVLDNGFAVLGYLHDRGSRHLERIRKDAEDFQRYQTQYRSLPDSAGSRELSEKVAQDYNIFTTQGARLIALEDEKTAKLNALFENLDRLDRLIEDKVLASIDARTPDAFRKLHAAAQLASGASGMTRFAMSALRATSPGDVARLREEATQFRRHLAVYRSFPLSGQESAWASEMDRLFARCAVFADKVNALAAQTRLGMAQYLQTQQALDNILGDEIQLRSNTGIAAAAHSMEATAQRVQTAFIVLLLAGLGIGAVTAAVTIRRITRPLDRLITVARAITRGDASLRTRLSTGDEFQDLGEAFDAMLDARAQTEAQLRASEIRFRDMALNIPGVIYQWIERPDGSYGFTYLSPRTADYFGVSADEPEKLLALLDPEDAPRFRASIEEVKLTRAPWVFDARYVDPRDASVRRWRAMSRMTSESAAGMIFDGVLFDITEEKLAAERLADSEERFRALAEMSSDWCWETDVGLRFVATDIGKLSPNPIAIGQRRWDMETFGTSAGQWREHEKRMREQLPIRNFEYGRVRENGVRYWISIDGNPRYDPKGNFLGYFGVAHNITARKNAELALTTARERLDLALLGSGLTLWDFDIETDMAYLDPSWAKMAGVPAEAEYHIPISQLQALVHPDDAATMLERFREAVTGQQPEYSVDHRIKAGADWKWIYSHGLVTARDPQGRATRMTGTNADISARKAQEASLRALALEQDAMLSASPAGICLVRGRSVVRANRALEKLHGCGTDELVGLPVSRFYARPADWQWMVREGCVAMRERGLLEAEFEFLRKDGTTFWGYVQGVLIDPGHPDAESALFAITDMSERRRAEQQIVELNAELEARVRERTAQLASSNDLFQSLAEVSPVGIFRADAAGACTFVNRRWCEIAGLSPSRALGNGWLAAVHPEDRARIKAAWRAGIEAGTPSNAEYRFRRDDRTITWVAAQTMELSPGSGEAAGFVGTITDINMQKRTELVLRMITGAKMAADDYFNHVASELAAMLEAGYAFIAVLSEDGSRQVHTLAICLDGVLVDNVVHTLTAAVYEPIVNGQDAVFTDYSLRHFPREAMPGAKTERAYAAVPLFGVGGKVLGVMGVMRRAPIREGGEILKALALLALPVGAEIERQKSDRQFRELFELAPDPMFMVDANGIILLANQLAQSRFGYVRNELIGRPVELLLPAIAAIAHDLLRAENSPDAGQRKVAPVAASLSALDREGRAIPVEVRLSPIESSGQRFVLAAVRDMSARKEFEEKLQSLNATLEQQVAERTIELTAAGQQLRQMTDGLPGAVYQFSWPPGGKLSIHFISEGVRELTGISRETAESDAEQLFDTVMAEDREPLVRSIESATITGQKIWSHEFRVRRTDATVLWTRAMANRFEHAHQTVWNGYWWDISERRAFELQLSESKETADAANRAKSSFLTTMSHEIRTPMNAIIGIVDLLADADLKPDERNLLGTMRESSKSLLGIINDVLDISKIEAEQVAISREPVALADLTASVLLAFAGQAESKGVALTRRFDSAIAPVVSADPLRIRQILFNLVSNAVKFTERGHIELRAQLEGMTVGGVQHVLFEVEDTGPGIEPETLEYLFQPFIQGNARTTQRYGGSGLGLAISRGLARMMGGEVTLESVPERGTICRLRLPLPVTNEPLPMADTTTELAIAWSAATDASAGNTGRPRVLAVDDHPVNLDVILRQLIHLGYAAEGASGGVEALEKWSQGDFALVLADCQMPLVDGYELARRIRTEESRRGAGSRIPIVACTANAMREDAERCTAAGMDDFLAKPVEMAVLARKLAKWLPANGKNPAKNATTLPSAQPATDATAPVRRRTPSGSKSAPIDHAALARVIGPDAAMQQSVLMKFRDAKIEEGRSLQAALDRADLELTAALSHRLGGAALTVGATSLAAICVRITMAARKGNARAARALRKPLASEIDRLATYLRSEVG